MKRRSVLAATALPFMVGCATKGPVIPFYRINIQDYAGVVYLPPLHAPVTVNIGDRMISTRRVAIIPYIRLESDYVVDVPYDKSWVLANKLVKGDYLLVATDRAGGNYFRPSTPISTIYKPIDPAKKDTEGTDHFGGIFVNAAGKVFVFVHWNGYAEPSIIHPAPEIKFLSESIERELPGENLQKELIYLGLSQTTITLRYREYWRGVSRPDFSLEVRYDLSQGKSIGYRESRFDILDVNNTTITYRATAHLK